MSDGVRENCGNCRFFAGDEEDGGDELFSEGLCKAHPPVVIVVDPGYRSVFPMTERGGWCGEFAPSKEGEYAESAEPAAVRPETREQILRRLREQTFERGKE